jgi:hypothetical protein
MVGLLKHGVKRETLFWIDHRKKALGAYKFIMIIP